MEESSRSKRRGNPSTSSAGDSSQSDASSISITSKNDILNLRNKGFSSTEEYVSLTKKNFNSSFEMKENVFRINTPLIPLTVSGVNEKTNETQVKMNEKKEAKKSGDANSEDERGKKEEEEDEDEAIIYKDTRYDSNDSEEDFDHSLTTESGAPNPLIIPPTNPLARKGLKVYIFARVYTLTQRYSTKKEQKIYVVERLASVSVSLYDTYIQNSVHLDISCIEGIDHTMLFQFWLFIEQELVLRNPAWNRKTTNCVVRNVKVKTLDPFRIMSYMGFSLYKGYTEYYLFMSRRLPKYAQLVSEVGNRLVRNENVDVISQFLVRSDFLAENVFNLYDKKKKNRRTDGENIRSTKIVVIPHSNEDLKALEPFIHSLSSEMISSGGETYTENSKNLLRIADSNLKRLQMWQEATKVRYWKKNRELFRSESLHENENGFINSRIGFGIPENYKNNLEDLAAELVNVCGKFTDLGFLDLLEDTQAGKKMFFYIKSNKSEHSNYEILGFTFIDLKIVESEDEIVEAFPFRADGMFKRILNKRQLRRATEIIKELKGSYDLGDDDMDEDDMGGESEIDDDDEDSKKDELYLTPVYNDKSKILERPSFPCVMAEVEYLCSRARTHNDAPRNERNGRGAGYGTKIFRLLQFLVTRTFSHRAIDARLFLTSVTDPRTMEFYEKRGLLTIGTNQYMSHNLMKRQLNLSIQPPPPDSDEDGNSNNNNNNNNNNNGKMESVSDDDDEDDDGMLNYVLPKKKNKKKQEKKKLEKGDVVLRDPEEEIPF